ncbi:MAG: hypothetical protein JO363_16640 [Solirubrobacterales bacterium]|nr:hypothetical protein [Solirubrobacterales bacterium]
MAASVIAGVAVVVSFLTFVWTYWASQRSERRTRMPVLVLFPDQSGWRLENIGNGPAINIVIAQGRGPATDGCIDIHGRVVGRDGCAPGESWCNPIHLRPMATGGSQTVPWRFSTTGVGVSYTDPLGSVYTLLTSRHGSRVIEKQAIPSWTEDEWRQLSQVEASTDGRDASGELTRPWAVKPE